MPHPVPRCSLRQTAAFLRDPAVFTSGPGLRIGETYRIAVPGGRLLVTAAPESFEEVLVRRPDDFRKSRVYWGAFRRMLGDAMGALDGEPWALLNEVQSPHFRPRAVRRHLGSVVDATREMTRGLDSGQPVAVLETLSTMNARMVLATLFATPHEKRAGEIARRVADGNRILDWISRVPWRRFTSRLIGVSRRTREHSAFFDRYVEALRHQQATRPSALLRSLEDFMAGPRGGSFSGNLLRNELIFHLGASTETQAAAEGWGLYLLWKNPDVLAQLREEVERVTNGTTPGPDHLDRLDLTTRVVQETLRLYPPVYGIVRDCRRAVRLGALELEPGDTVLLNTLGMHRSPRLWDDPEAFRPGRFRGPDAARAIRSRYLPFGAGRHVCTGRHLAMPAMTLTLAQLAQRFDWEFMESDVTVEARPSLKPAGTFRAKFFRRA